RKAVAASRVLSISSTQVTQRRDQRLVLRRRAYRDAQELGDARLPEVTHDHALLAQGGCQLTRVARRMTGEHEVGRRGEYLEAQPAQLGRQLLAAVDDLAAAGLEVLAVLEGGRGTGDRSEEHTSELQSRENLVCRLLLEKKNGHLKGAQIQGGIIIALR